MKDFAFHQLIQGDCSELNKWIDQVSIDFEKGGCKGVFLVLFKINQRGTYVVYKGGCGLEMHKSNFVIYDYKDSNFVIAQCTDDWLNFNKENFLKLCKKD